MSTRAILAPSGTMASRSLRSCSLEMPRAGNPFNGHWVSESGMMQLHGYHTRWKGRLVGNSIRNLEFVSKDADVTDRGD